MIQMHFPVYGTMAIIPSGFDFNIHFLAHGFESGFTGFTGFTGLQRTSSAWV